MVDVGRLLILVGIFLILFGLLMSFFPHIPLGKLPGDIYIRKGSISFFFPLITSLILSALLTLLLNLFFTFFKHLF